MPDREHVPSEWDLDFVPKDVYQKQAADEALKRVPRTRNVRVPRIISIKVATDTTAASWVRYDGIKNASVIQLLLNGLPTAHPLYVTHEPADDSTQPLGRFLANAGGAAYALQEGPIWLYIPSLAGDGASFSAVVLDVGSELPAQLAALQAAGISGLQTVTTLNRGAFKTDQLTVATSGTPVNYTTSRSIPNGFGLLVAALPSNTKNVYLGSSTGDALNSSGHGLVIAPGSSVKIYVTNWNLIWIDSLVNGEGVSLGSET